MNFKFKIPQLDYIFFFTGLILFAAALLAFITFYGSVSLNFQQASYNKYLRTPNMILQIFSIILGLFIIIVSFKETEMIKYFCRKNYSND